jgi:general secretion pathway protein D
MSKGKCLLAALAACLICVCALPGPGWCKAKKTAAPREERLEINFREADVMAVLQFYSDMLGKTFIPADDLKGKVTVISAEPVTRTEAKRMLFSILDVKGYSVVEMDNVFKVVKKKDAVQDALAVSGAPFGGDQMYTEIFYFQHTDAKGVVEDIRRVLSPEASVFAGSDANYLVVSDRAHNIGKVREIIKKIDLPIYSPVTRPYRLQYLKAENMAQVIGDVFKRDAKDSKAAQLQILPVKDTNTLVVTATGPIQDKVGELVRLMDKRTLQVSISAMLVEVRLNEASRMGLEWKLRAWAGGGYTDVAQDLGHIMTTPVGPNIMKYSDPALKAAMSYSIFPGGYLDILVHMISSDENAKIISAPHLLVTDNQEATISIGDEIPILKEYRLDNNNQPIQTFSQRKFGLDLKITPTISDSGDVTLKVSQKLSNLVSEDPVNHTYRAAERAADTTVLVHDKQTLVIGGLMQNTGSRTQQGVPVLRKVPGVGYLFGDETQDGSKRELLLFVTPTVVTNPDQAEQMARDYKEQKPDLVDQVGVEFDL